MATGRTPALIISATHAPATSFLSNAIRTGLAPTGLLKIRSVASVTTPNWPSEPQITPSKSRPAESK